MVKVAQEARVDLPYLPALAARLRALQERIGLNAYRLEIVLPERVSALLPELKEVSDAWLFYENEMERGYSIPFFNDRYLATLPIAVLRRDDRVVAFGALRESGDKRELALDLLRHHPDVPKDCVDFLVLDLLQRAKAAGYREFNLGIAPLALAQANPIAPAYGYENILYCQNGQPYDATNLYRWEDLVPMNWRPKYLAYPKGLNVYRVLHAISRLIAGGE